MNPFFNLEQFIAHYITERQESLFKRDLEVNQSLLQERIDNKSVLVIGGAGTIGASFVKAVLRFKPSKLYVIDISENGLTELVRDLRSSLGFHIPEDFKTYPINFGDTVFEKIFEKEGPFDIVANFAAHKHVRSEKDEYSIEAMIANNVLNAKRLLDLLLKSPPKHFFCVSTDKAANPVNVMGASKKLMEDVILAYSKKIPITTARFANVAFSNGSLLAGFLERLSKRQPFSSPNDVRRYFVSPEESGQLCLLACILGNSGEIFFPKLDPNQDLKPFSDIGTALLKSIGYDPDYCESEQEAREKAHKLNGQYSKYPVYYFATDTSGEKAFEEFYTASERKDLNRFQALGVIRNIPRTTFSDLAVMFKKLENLFLKDDLTKREIVELLQDFIPNFSHIEKEKNLDQKM